MLVVGAGPAGSTAACLLARQGWDVLLVDRARFPRPKTCGDGLTPRAVATLERLDLLEAVLAAAPARIYRRVTGRDRLSIGFGPDRLSGHRINVRPGRVGLKSERSEGKILCRIW